MKPCVVAVKSFLMDQPPRTHTVRSVRTGAAFSYVGFCYQHVLQTNIASAARVDRHLINKCSLPEA